MAAAAPPPWCESANRVHTGRVGPVREPMQVYFGLHCEGSTPIVYPMRVITIA